MRLTTFSDYAFRVLMYAGTHPDRLVTITETAEVYDVSRAHLMKVVNALTRAGYLKGVRGRSGGFTLAMEPGEINLGAVIRKTEPDFALTECFAPENGCLITEFCSLPNILNQALGAFIGVLDSYTLSDVLPKRRDFETRRRPDGLQRGPIMDGPPARPEKAPAGN